jgi:hypothetical protein
LGKKAFEGKSQLSVASVILEKEPEPVSAVKPLTPGAVDRTIRKCLAKSAAERWQSASDLATQLNWVTQGSGTFAASEVGQRRKWERLGLLLLSAESLATRLERKHQWAVTTILPEENRPLRLYPVRSG